MAGMANLLHMIFKWKWQVLRRKSKIVMEGFHVMSYWANFATYPTCDRHVGFLLHAQIKENTTKCLFTFLFHNTIPNYDWVTSILKHTHSVEILDLAVKYVESNSMFCSFPYTTPYKKETKEQGKIVRVYVRNLSCKLSIVIRFSMKMHLNE